MKANSIKILSFTFWIQGLICLSANHGIYAAPPSIPSYDWMTPPVQSSATASTSSSSTAQNPMGYGSGDARPIMPGPFNDMGQFGPMFAHSFSDILKDFFQNSISTQMFVTFLTEAGKAIQIATVGLWNGISAGITDASKQLFNDMGQNSRNSYWSFGILTTQIAAIYSLVSYGIPYLLEYIRTWAILGLYQPPQLAMEESETPFEFMLNRFILRKKYPLIEDLIFSDEIKSELNTFIQQLKTATKFKKNLPTLLLYGPPGTGKTAISKRIAIAGNYHYVFISGSSFSQYEEHIAIREINRLFYWAKRKGRTVIFIDEAEAMLTDRNASHISEKTMKILAHFLTFTSERSPQYTIIAATNRPELLDEALIRRFTVHIELLAPDLNAREQLFNKYFNEELVSDSVVKFSKDLLAPEFIHSLAELTEGRTGADILDIAANLKLISYGDPNIALTQKNVLVFVEQFLKKYSLKSEKSISHKAAENT